MISLLDSMPLVMSCLDTMRRLKDVLRSIWTSAPIKFEVFFIMGVFFAKVASIRKIHGYIRSSRIPPVGDGLLSSHKQISLTHIYNLPSNGKHFRIHLTCSPEIQETHQNHQKHSRREHPLHQSILKFTYLASISERFSRFMFASNATLSLPTDLNRAESAT